MKKILKGIMVLSLCLVTSIGSVKAIANIGGGGVGGTAPGGDCRIKGMCMYNNRRFLALRATLVYINKGVLEEVYPSFIFAKDDTNYLLNNVKIDKKYLYEADDWGAEGIDLNSNLKYKVASDTLRNFFDDKKEDLNNDKEINGNLKKFIVKSVNAGKGKKYSWKEVKEKVLLKKETEYANKNKAAKKGWRILIEPLMNYTYTESLPRLWTPKEYAQYFGVDKVNTPVTINGLKKTGKQWISIQNINPLTGSKYAQSQYLFTEFKDVGISAPKQNGKWAERRDICSKISVSKLAATIEKGKKITHGCGLNIYDVGLSPTVTTCYKVEDEYEDVTCEKNDDYNIGEYRDVVKSVECKTNSDLYKQNKKGTISKWGTKIAEENGCTLYVKESGRVKLPGGITKTETLGKDIVDGGYFAWPAKYNANKGLKLEMKTKFLFRRIGKEKCNSTKTLEILYDKGQKYVTGKLKFGAKLTAGDNKALVNYNLVETNRREKTYRRDEFLANKKYTFSVVTKVNLEIDNKKNRLQNKGNSTVRDYSDADKSSGLYIDRGEGVISLKKTLKYNGDSKEVPLKLTDIELGANGRYKISNYVCKAKVGITCVCPPDSRRAGETITDVWKGTGGTCEEVQKEYCYPPSSKDVCIKDDNTEVDITDCVDEEKKKNKSYEDAKAICTKRYCGHPCPNTNYNVPVDEWNKCVDEEDNTESDCEELLCSNWCYKTNKQTGEVVKIDISECMAEGLSKQTCTQAKCASPCPGCSGLCDSWNQKPSSNNTGDIIVSGTGTNPSDNSQLTCSIEIRNCYKGCVANKLIKDGVSVDKNLNGLAKALTDSDGKLKGDVDAYLAECRKETSCGTTKGKNAQNSIYNDLIARSVDLNNPFPGSKGLTRKPGSNWLQSDVEKVIKNGRNAQGYALYNQTPLYTITLDHDSLTEIKKYNKKYALSEYHDIKCSGTNGTTACTSGFLHNANYIKINKSKSVGACSSLSKGASEEKFKECYGE